MLAFYLSMIESEEDKNKFEEIYETYIKYMYLDAYDILKDKQLAEDAVQIAFVRLTRHLHKFDETKCHKTKLYVIKVIRSVANAMYNKRKKVQTVNFEELEYEVEQESNLEDEVIANAELRSLIAEIKRLPPTYRDVIVYRYFDNYSDDEIAKLLNISKSNVRKRVERARKKLVESLNEKR